MINFLAHDRSAFQRAEFATQFCLGSGIPVVLMGFYDSTKRAFRETWFGSDGPPDAGRQADLAAAADMRMAIHTAVRPAERRPGFLSAAVRHGKTGVSILNEKDYVLGICDPVSGIYPVMAIDPGPALDRGIRRALLQIGTTYVAQQLQRDMQPRSIRAEELLDAALNALSIDILTVTAHGTVEFDSRRDDNSPDAPDWILCNRRLTPRDSQQRQELETAVRLATGEEAQTSILSVFTRRGTAKLIVVTPVPASDPPLAMILSEGGSVDHFRLREQFFNAYGLTRSERLTGHEILSGKTVAETAEATNLSVATVRSYMKQIFGKTGAHRQGELIALYFTSILPIAFRPEAAAAPLRNRRGGVMMRSAGSARQPSASP